MKPGIAVAILSLICVPLFGVAQGRDRPGGLVVSKVFLICADEHRIHRIKIKMNVDDELISFREGNRVVSIGLGAIPGNQSGYDRSTSYLIEGGLNMKVLNESATSSHIIADIEFDSVLERNFSRAYGTVFYGRKGALRKDRDSLNKMLASWHRCAEKR